MHTKRLAAPSSVRIPRKEKKWVVSHSPGPYRKERSVPMLVVLRDLIGCCDRAKEGKFILAKRLVKVDGRVVTDLGFPVGLMNSLSVGEDHYRVTLDNKGFKFVKSADPETKLVRIEDIRNVKGGKFQISTHDGRNILMDAKGYSTGTTLRIKVPDQEIMEHYELKEDALALVTRGKHMGKMAQIKGLRAPLGLTPAVVVFDEFEVPMDCVFVVGGD